MGPPGHFAIAFAAKPVALRVPLWQLLVATEILTLLAFGFMALGIEHGGPNPTLAWAPGLFLSVVWSMVSGVIAYLTFHSWKASLVMGIFVSSHWVLDFISHTPDLPLLFHSSPPVGLDLENSISGGMIMEFTMLFAGVAIYLRFGRWSVRQSVMQARISLSNLWIFQALSCAIAFPMRQWASAKRWEPIEDPVFLSRHEKFPAAAMIWSIGGFMISLCVPVSTGSLRYFGLSSTSWGWSSASLPYTRLRTRTGL